MMNFNISILLVSLFFPLFCGAQEKDHTYQLSEDGEQFEKPVVYLLEDSFEGIIDEGENLIFLTKHE